MTTSPLVAAIDLGATSGRVITGQLRDGRLESTLVHRFSNDPVALGDGLHWNLVGLYDHALSGIASIERDQPGSLASIGIDAWAVDYGLLRGDRLLGNPYHYRDSRCAEGVDTVHSQISAAELYQRNGLQHLDFNTLFQLAVEGDLLHLADRMLLVPDLLAFWLTGAVVAEHTNASTTGLLDPVTGSWDNALIAQLGFPPQLFPRLVDPGSPLGTLRPEVAHRVGRAIDVTTVASHDTASAVAATPLKNQHSAYVSCGTWGLVGFELPEPVLTDAAQAANFTNEGGIHGTTRFLHNVMGLWLLSESLRSWAPGATDAQRQAQLATLLDAAAQVTSPLPIFDANDPVFLPPGDMPARIATWFHSRGERAPEHQAEMVRCIIESLAAACAQAVHTGAALANIEVHEIHLVGGGSQNVLLCQALASRAGLPVHAGPVEATAMGNMLVQLQAIGELAPELASLREVVARSAPQTTYLPQ